MEVQKGGSVKVEAGIVTITYAANVDGDGDGRAASGIEVKAFADLPEVMDESLKDNATAQMLAKWFDANKALLPAIEKAI